MVSNCGLPPLPLRKEKKPVPVPPMQDYGDAEGRTGRRGRKGRRSRNGRKGEEEERRRGCKLKKVLTLFVRRNDLHNTEHPWNEKAGNHAEARRHAGYQDVRVRKLGGMQNKSKLGSMMAL